jgi:hypothetical protein
VASRDVFLRDALAKFLLIYTDYREPDPCCSWHLCDLCYRAVPSLVATYHYNNLRACDVYRNLPLHLVLSRDHPNLEIVYLLVGAYPEGLFDPDYDDHLPYDKYVVRLACFVRHCAVLFARKVRSVFELGHD